ncbi:MAG: hypothetical protein WC462_01780 [archaeon]
MDKKIGFGVILVLLVFLVAVIIWQQNFAQNNSADGKQNILVDTNKSIDSAMNAFCGINFASGLVESVTQCDLNGEKIYVQNYEFLAEDQPIEFYDANKQLLFDCGGMPTPYQQEDDVRCTIVDCKDKFTHTCKYTDPSICEIYSQYPASKEKCLGKINE